MTTSTSTSDLPIAVIGAGISGLAAAVDLVDAGRRVVVFERRALLGGRATSWVDRVSGDVVDNGQHIVLGCCTNALDLFDRLGTSDRLKFHDAFTYVTPDRKRHRFARGPLPAPLHFGPALMRFGVLDAAGRRAVARAFRAMMKMDETRLVHAGRGTMADWLATQRQPEAVVRRFWEPILVSAVNEELDRVSALPCLQVFLQGFMPHRDAARMGVPTCGLADLFAEPAARYLEERGSEVRRRTNVRRVEIDDSDGNGDRRRVRAVESTDGERIDVDGVVVAVPFHRVGKLGADTKPRHETEEHHEHEHENHADIAAPTSSWSTVPDLGHAPIAGVHLWLDRVAVDLPHAFLLDSPIHWIFAKSPATSRERLGAKQRLAVVISASHSLTSMGQDELAELAWREIRERFPSATDARVLRHVVVKEDRATPAFTPDAETRRPGPRTDIKNVVLAGDWTATRWPSTLEGSVRSGRLAAAAFLDDEDDHLVADLPRSLLARLLLRRVPLCWPTLTHA